MKHSITKLNQWTIWVVFLAAIVFSNPSNALDNVGRVIFSSGNINAINNGETRLMKRGSAIHEGDVLKTGASTTTHLRMSDGALVALKSNTKFRIDKYQYSKNSTISSSIFNLMKGGFRTITGWIGKHNKKNYRVKTTVATLGIRGTHYGLTLCTQGDCGSDDEGTIEDGLYGSVIDGEIFTENESGIHTFSNDEYFHIASRDSKPRSLLRPPGVIFNQDNIRNLKKTKENEQELLSLLKNGHLPQSDIWLTSVEKQNEFIRYLLAPRFEAARDTNTNTNSFLTPTDVGNTLVFSFFESDASGVSISVLDKTINDGTTDNQFFINSIAKENGLFIPVAVKQTIIDSGIRTLFIADAQPLEPQSITIPNTTVSVGWGRWSNQYAATFNGVEVLHDGQLHYIAATETTDIDRLGQLGGLVGAVTYSTIAGTRATDLNGNIAADVATVSMDVDFAPATAPPGITSFSIVTNVGGSTYEASLEAPTPFAEAITAGLNLLGRIACQSCSGRASIDFFGPNAEGAGTVYYIMDQATSNAINGAAILVR